MATGPSNYLHDIEDVFPTRPRWTTTTTTAQGTTPTPTTTTTRTTPWRTPAAAQDTDGFSNQYDATSLPDDYDGDMDCDTFDADDDNDGVNDGPDPHADECYWSDNDQDGTADYNDEGGSRRT